eukprot:405802-Heterocapsa_arctica.AAC.1
MCGAPNAGVEHIWWECPSLNGVVNFGLQKVKQRRAKETNKPGCFWMAGIVPSGRTTLPDMEHMRAVEVCHPCKGNVKHVYIDGSATK